MIRYHEPHILRFMLEERMSVLNAYSVGAYVDTGSWQRLRSVSSQKSAVNIEITRARSGLDPQGSPIFYIQSNRGLGGHH